MPLPPPRITPDKMPAMGGPRPAGPMGPPPVKAPAAKAPAPAPMPESAGAPNFKTGDQLDSERCFACANWDEAGQCKKFGNPCQAMDTCEGFEPGEGGEVPMEEGTEGPPVGFGSKV